MNEAPRPMYRYKSACTINVEYSIPLHYLFIVKAGQVGGLAGRQGKSIERG